MMFFAGSYLVLATSTMAIAAQLFPLILLGVLFVDCSIYHAMRTAAGEWWVLQDQDRAGVGAWLVDFTMNTALWLTWRVGPLWTMRDPNWTGPPVMAFNIVCSLIEYTTVVFTVLLSPSAHDSMAQPHKMARFICLPAMCVALVSFMAFFGAMEKQYLRTFYARDSRLAMNSRNWANAVGRATADEDRAHMLVHNTRYLGDLACAWIVDGAVKWELLQAAWYTEEWRQLVRSRAHLMGPRATEALAALDRQPLRSKLAKKRDERTELESTLCV